MRPHVQRVGGRFSFFIKTTSPSSTLGSLFNHLPRCCKVCKYSSLHARQNCCPMRWTNCQRFKMPFSLTNGSGFDNNGRPIRKWPGVRTIVSMLGSSFKAVRGLEFKQASIEQSTVVISSYVNYCWPIVRFIWYLVDLTAASCNPPKWGAPGGMSFHFVPVCAKLSWISDDRSKFHQ